MTNAMRLAVLESKDVCVTRLNSAMFLSESEVEVLRIVRPSKRPKSAQTRISGTGTVVAPAVTWP